MAEEKKQSVTVYSYRKVWFVEKKIYAFQNIVLPFPIAPYEVLEFLAVVGAMLVMGRIFPILNNIPVVLRYGTHIIRCGQTKDKNTDKKEKAEIGT